MIELLPETSSSDLDIVDAYWKVRKTYEAVFGKLSFSEAIAPGSLTDKITEMQDKLDEHYRLQRDGSRTRKLAHA